MWQLPPELATQLKCTNCDSFLTIPCYAAGEYFICSVCLKQKDRNKCSRQSGLEILLPHILFPCKYSDFGCNVRLGWETIEEHIKNCSHRTLGQFFPVTSAETLRTFNYLDEPLSPTYSNISSLGSTCNEERTSKNELIVKMSCKPKGNRTTKKFTVLNFNMEILPSNQEIYLLSRGSTNFKYAQKVSLDIVGSISLKTKPEVMDWNINLIPVENVYDTIEICVNCDNYIYNANCISCNYGHLLCEECGDNCKVCERQIKVITTTVCKYGCLWQGSCYEVKDHERQCPNITLPCMFGPKCDWKSSEQLMAQHILQKHPENTHPYGSIVKPLVKKDYLFIMIAYNRIFICKQYFYNEQLEIMVDLYANAFQNFYSFSVEVSLENALNISQKKSKCGIFNKSALEEGVVFSKGELEAFKNNNLQLKIEILQNELSI